MPPKNKRQKKQEVLVIVGALGVIVASVVTTLFLSGFLMDQFSSEDGGYKNVTFTDALLTCDQYTRQSFSGKLTRLNVDDHSSRFDPSSNQYKIFYMAEAKSSDSETGMGEFYVNCFVNAERGKVAYYESLEKKDAKTEAIRKQRGGLFGWPID